MVISMDDTVREKRLVLHSDEDVAMALQTISAEVRWRYAFPHVLGTIVIIGHQKGGRFT